MNESIFQFHQLLLDKGITFARFSLPRETKTITIVSFNPISYDKIDQLADNQDEGFVFAPFIITKENPIRFLKSDKIIDDNANIKAITKDLKNLPDFDARNNLQINSTTKSDYETAFDKFMQELSSDKLKKAILSKIVTKKRTKEPLLSMFTRIVKTYPAAFTYMIYLPTGEIWIGATPELLVKQNKNGIQTMALAGTQVLDNRLLKELVWENKEIEEQAYVKSFISNVLISVSDSVNVSNTYSSEAGNLAHLQTDFIVNQNFNRSEVVEIIKNLHPTPAVCGIPLDKSKALILKTEQHSRDYYSGFLGPINNNSMSLFVNLRCMRVLPETFALYVGGGITIDSEMEKEWQETESKAQTLLSVLDCTDETSTTKQF